MGNILTGFFATDKISNLGNTGTLAHGWLDQNYMQVVFQLAVSFAGGVYSFVVTAIILFILNQIPGLGLRVSEEAEVLGVDDSEIGEFAYDYVELMREVGIDGGAGSMMDGETGSLYSTGS